ncbi:MAG: alanine:cation symporter family protein, partial [Phascolarctobacterium sp.]|nr:alanine:cation symporter family protein [Phascolarctobacterium sp.]
ICASKTALNVYRVMVVGMVMFGSVAEVPLVWNLADLFMALMAIVNLVAIAQLSNVSYLALKDYLAQKRAGITEPEFDQSVIPDQKGIYCWGNEKK